MTGRYRRVWVVFRKELLDTLRDRRTLMAAFYLDDPQPADHSAARPTVGFELPLGTSPKDK